MICYDQQETAMIRKKAKLIQYDQQAKLQCKATLAKGHTRNPAIPRGPPRRSHTEKTASQPTRSSLTLPKGYLATFKLIANDELGSRCLKG